MASSQYVLSYFIDGKKSEKFLGTYTDDRKNFLSTYIIQDGGLCMNSRENHIQETGDRHPQMKKLRRSSVILFSGLSFVLVLVAVLSTLFIRRIRTIADNETFRYLSELTQSAVFLVDAKVDANLTALAQAASEYARRGEGAAAERLAALRDVANSYSFSTLFVMDTAGTAVSLEGAAHDFSMNDVIMRVLEGESFLVSGMDVYSDDDHGFVFCVPIIEDGTVTGALLACGELSGLLDFMNEHFFAINGFFHIVERDGTYILRTSNPNAVISRDNLFQGLSDQVRLQGKSLSDIYDDFASKQSGNVRLYVPEDGTSRIMNYIPIGHSDLYLLFLVTEFASTWQFSGLVREVAAVIVVVVLLLAMLTALLFFSYRGKNKALASIAFEDPVTGGFSETRFRFEAERLIRSAPAGTYTLAVMDLRNFKLINEMFGSENGDRLLRYVYDILCRLTADGELVSRIFADDYVLLLRDRSRQDILMLIQRISTEINRFNSGRDSKYYLSISVGAYEIDEPDMSVPSIQDRAGMARKEVSNGKSHLYSCAFYSDENRMRLYREQELANKMDGALVAHEFEAFLQPKLEVRSGRIAGAEALVRWNSPERGLIFPDEFVPFFERNGFVVQLDLYVFEEVCRKLRGWIDTGKVPICISVNLSRVHLNDPDFLVPFIAIQKKYDIPGEFLEFELTESLLTENFKLVVGAIDCIHAAGFYCSLDDFGSGFSSLNLLADVHVDTIKLDRAFFRTLNPEDGRKHAIIESIIAMAKKLNMTTVAEGVESKDQVEYLRSIRCDFIQGYAISKPIPSDRFEQLFLREGERF